MVGGCGCFWMVAAGSLSGGVESIVDWFVVTSWGVWVGVTAEPPPRDTLGVCLSVGGVWGGLDMKPVGQVGISTRISDRQEIQDYRAPVKKTLCRLRNVDFGPVVKRTTKKTTKAASTGASISQ